MSYKNGPKIVTDGLYICLDAGNLKSYSGAGTTWKDISGNGVNGTLGGTTNPTYSSFGNGSFLFDGANYYQTITCADTISHKTGQSFSYEAWIYFTSFTGYDKIFVGKEGCNVGLMEINSSIYMAVVGPNGPCAGGNVGANVNVAGVLNRWNHYIGTYTAGSSVSLYANGAIVGTTAFSTALGDYGNTLRLGGDNGLAVYTNRCYLSAVRVYNRALNSNEVLQNYNALKGRFGL